MTQTLTRAFALRIAAVDADDSNGDGAVIPCVLSSDTPVLRRDAFGGEVNEVLNHDAGAVDLSRAPLPLIESHDGRSLPIGLVDGLRVADGKLRGNVRFGNSARAREVAVDVRSGIIRSLSVGYRIDSYEYLPAADDEQPDTLIAKRWQPMEVSAVAIPADTSAGFNRGFSAMDPTEHTTRSQRRAAAAEIAAGDAARDRAAHIAALAQRHGMSDHVTGWLSRGATLEDVRAEILEARSSSAIRVMIPELDQGRSGRPPISADSPIPVEELRKYSLLRAIRHVAMGKDDRRYTQEAGFELEVSRTLADHADRAARGIMVPEEVLFGMRGLSAPSARALTVGSATAGGNLVATDLLGGDFIESLANQPQVLALGARALTGLQGNVAIPRQTSGSTIHWISEGADYGDTSPAFDQPQMTPHDASARVDISRRLMIQSTPAADALVRSDLAQRIGIAIDLAAIAGTGSSGQPTGLLSTSGLGLVALGTNGAAPTWAALTQVVQAVATANALRGSLGWLVNGATQGCLMRTPKQTGYPVYCWETALPGARPDEGSIAGYKALVSNNAPNNGTKGTGTNLSTLLFGNWEDVLIGLWRGVDIVVDPYSQSSTGTTRITAIQTLDVLVRHIASFTAITDAVTT